MRCLTHAQLHILSALQRAGAAYARWSALHRQARYSKKCFEADAETGGYIDERVTAML